MFFVDAGLMPLSPLKGLRIEEWDRMCDVTVKGTLHGVAAALPETEEQKAGHVIIVSCVHGHKVVASGAAACASRHAVGAISEGLRREVRVTTLSPGAVRAELTSRITEPGLADDVTRFVGDLGVPAGAMAIMLPVAIAQHRDVDVNAILFRPPVEPV